MRRRGILLTTYGMVQRNASELDHLPSDLGRDEDEDAPVWDWVFLDEVWRCCVAPDVDCSPLSWQHRLRTAYACIQLQLKTGQVNGNKKGCQGVFAVKLCHCNLL